MEEEAYLDPSFASSLKLSLSASVGKGISVHSDVESMVPIIPCPLVWGWLIGGVNGIPAMGTLGCDGPSGNFKTALAWEHLKWTIQAKGVGIYIDNEERPNPQYLRSMICDLPFEARLNLIFESSTSIEEWQDKVMGWKKKSMKFSEKEPDNRVPMFVVVDSLTGRGTQGEQDIAKKKGIAPRGFSDTALSISKFYKSFSREDDLFTLFHVQHSKKSMDPYAHGDDEIVASGGTEPRYNASYHFRSSSVKEAKAASYPGADGAVYIRDITLKCVKSSLGDNKRKLTVRACWEYVWMDMPLYEIEGSGDGVGYDIEWEGGTELSPEEAVAWWEKINPHIPIDMAMQIGKDTGILLWRRYFKLMSDLTSRLEGAETDSEKKELEKAIKDLEGSKPKSGKIQIPKCEPEKVQRTWFDWDYSLGYLIVDGIVNNSKVYASEKNDLIDALGVVTSGCNKGYVKSKKIFGNSEPVPYTVFGRAIQDDPELYKVVSRHLGIKKRMHFAKVPHKKTKKTKSKGTE